MPEDLDLVSQESPVRHCPELCEEEKYEIIKMTESSLNLNVIRREFISPTTPEEEWYHEPEYVG